MSYELDFAVEAVRSAGELILEHFGKPIEVRLKDEGSPVTVADSVADALLRKELTQRFPADGWVSEETADNRDRLARERVWVVDPLDGTKEFVRGLPEFAISVALVKAGMPILGIVYNPALNELYAAEKGSGTCLNGRRTQISGTTEFEGAHLLASRSENEFFVLLSSLLHIRPVGSVAYKLALIAAGTADLIISFRPKSEWDVCAGTLLVEEAGGRVTDLTGSPLRFNRPDPKLRGVIAGNSTVHRQALLWVSNHPMQINS